MKVGLIFLFSCLSLCIQAQDQFQLAQPQFRYTSVFFENEVTVPLEFSMKDAKIYYTANGEIPSEKDSLYSTPIIITNKLITIKARAFAQGFIPSDVAQATFIRRGHSIEQMSLSNPNTKYSGSGSNTLFDNLGGMLDHTSKTWLGYDQGTITCRVKLEAYQSVHAVLLHMLENPGAWIFAPTEVEVYAIDRKTEKLTPITKEAISPTAKDALGCRPIVISFPEIETETIVISIRAVTSIPDWHPGKGKQGWLFIDEINVY